MCSNPDAGDAARTIGMIACGLLLLLGCTPSERQAEAQTEAQADVGIVASTGRDGDRLITNTNPPPRAKQEFQTDFSRSLIDFSEVISGGPPKNGIPAIRAPQFESMAAADQWIGKNEMVFVIDGTRYGEEARIYPVQILIYHEIVNDKIGDTPVSITYCPLCNSAVAFSGEVNEHALTFGVSGRIRYSNMIMYDDQTESWWQQATGKAIVGDLVGTRLTIVPLLTASWSEVQERYENAIVLSRDTGHQRPYGRNPYRGYDTSEYPFLFSKRAIDTKEEPFARVVVGRADGEEKPFLYSNLETNIVTHDTIGTTEVVLFWAAGSASPLDAGNTADGRAVGSANIFNTQLGTERLMFTVEKGQIVDTKTNSQWSVLGTAVSGTLKGEQLTALPAIQHFWFSYAAFSDES